MFFKIIIEYEYPENKYMYYIRYIYTFEGF